MSAGSDSQTQEIEQTSNEAPALGKDSENLGSNSQVSESSANTVGETSTQEGSSNASAPEQSKDSELDAKTDEAPEIDLSGNPVDVIVALVGIENVNQEAVKEFKDFCEAPALGESSVSAESASVPAADSVDMHAETVVSPCTTEAPDLVPGFSLPFAQIYETPAYQRLIEQTDFDLDGAKTLLLQAMDKPIQYFWKLQDAAIDRLNAEGFVPPDSGRIAKTVSIWQLNHENVLRVEALMSPAVAEAVEAMVAYDERERIELKHNNKSVVSARFNEIVKRLGSRKAISKSWRDKATFYYPGLNDADDKAEYDKEYREHSKEYRNASWSVNPDMDVLVRVCERIQADHPVIDVGYYIEHCFDQVPRDAEPEPKPDKKEKEQRDLPGQQKIDFKVKDDGSQAEAASECEVTQIAPQDIDNELAKRDEEALPSIAEGAFENCAQECLEQAIEAGELPADIGAVDLTEHQSYLFDVLNDLDDECSDYLTRIINYAARMHMSDSELKTRLEHPLIPTYGAENLATVCDKLENDYLAFADKNSPPEKEPKAKQAKRPVAERNKAAAKKKK